MGSNRVGRLWVPPGADRVYGTRSIWRGRTLAEALCSMLDAETTFSLIVVVAQAESSRQFACRSPRRK